MIKSASSQPTSAKATVIGSKGRFPAISIAYEGFKHASRVYGFYKDIKPYLPETYLDKYRYKPHKRIISYAAQKIQRYKTNNKFRKTYGRRYSDRQYDKLCRVNRKGGYCSQ